MAYFDRKCALSEFFQTLSSNVSEDLRPSHKKPSQRNAAGPINVAHIGANHRDLFND